MFLPIFFLMTIVTSPKVEQTKPAIPVSISFDLAQELGNRIWKNECSGNIRGLTSWNEGEDFASLGIGHFIWYPAKETHRTFQETFPSLLDFMESCGVTVPAWLEVTKGCPWRNRQHFIKNIDSPKMEELRQFLYETRALQAIYMAKRVEDVLPTMTAKLELTKKKHVEKLFYTLAKTPQGMYVLIDYLNFKGSGASPQEAYANSGWGLLQVLLKMPDNTIRPLDDFVKAAKEVLANRVKNAPSGKNEQRWLKGWNARLDTYLVN